MALVLILKAWKTLGDLLIFSPTIGNKLNILAGKPRVKIPITCVRDCIEYVMVSPHGNKDRNKLLAELFRDKYDLKFDIEMSSSPYNGN